jgi:hypothetical protein
MVADYLQNHAGIDHEHFSLGFDHVGNAYASSEIISAL